ncbi:uncharacterized protein LOC129593103 [Paramacrobiotus metropolitanus]|uniref:uncharacterized protein LOC129593103 n=1 Tax=Paramacrobiotus metropolitanus TaxID=2943436 RepID=UPI002445DD4C|nr:uncharacterized protein LOC129593103 [Paramacrobiotus metropolitanus]
MTVDYKMWSGSVIFVLRAAEAHPQLFGFIVRELILCFVFSAACSVKYESHLGTSTTATAFTAVQTTNPTEEALRQLDKAMTLAGGRNRALVLKGISLPSPFLPLDIGQADVVIRASEGECVILQCTRENGLVLSDPVIRFNGKLLKFIANGLLNWREKSYYSCRSSSFDRKTETESIQIVKTDGRSETGSFQIKMTNFTHAHAGVYECLHENGSEFVAFKRFVLSPQLFHNRVFYPPMGNVTAVVGGQAELRCTVAFDAMPGTLDDFDGRIIWRKEHYLIFALGIPSFRKAVNRRALVKTGFDDGCYTSLIFDEVQLDDAGQYQCFFKTDDVFDEWFVQAAYLHVNTT